MIIIMVCHQPLSLIKRGEVGGVPYVTRLEGTYMCVHNFRQETLKDEACLLVSVAHAI